MGDGLHIVDVQSVAGGSLKGISYERALGTRKSGASGANAQVHAPMVPRRDVAERWVYGQRLRALHTAMPVAAATAAASANHSHTGTPPDCSGIGTLEGNTVGEGEGVSS